jgi:AmmeMemoRadiSam system protein A
MLTPDQKEHLLAVARRAVTQRVTDVGQFDRELAEALGSEPDASGVFVTLKLRGELRGCLGTLECQRSLSDEVSRCAAQSASEDPRFPPVTPAELPELALEISVLGPLEPIDPHQPDAFTIGQHGLVVEQRSRRGLLLPQVAVEWGWTPEQFLRQTCVKAGLPADAWRQEARVYRFDAEVFGE